MKKQVSVLLITFLLVGLVSTLSANADSEHFTPKALSELSGHTVGVQTGCLYEEFLLEKVPGAEVCFYSDPNTMFLALEQGKLDTMITESNSYVVEKKYHPALAALEEPVASINCGLVYGETERQQTIHDEMEVFIENYINDGTRDEMIDYWLTNYDPDTCDVDRSGITGEKGTITVAVEAGFEPFSYLSNGELAGYDIDFVYRFAREYGYEPEFLSLTFDAISPAVVTGKADFGTGVILSEERSEGALFSSAYTTYKLLVLYYDDAYEDSNGFLDSLADSFYRTFIKENRWEQFAKGTGITFLICVISVIVGTILGYGVYLLCKEGNRSFNKIAGILSWFLHGIPSVVFLMILNYIVFGNSRMSSILISIIGFSLMFCFSTYDMICSGVRAVGVGQYEAARAQGFSSNETFFRIQNPQAIWHFLPTYKSELVSLLKETSIVGYIAVQDLTKMSDIIRSRTYEAFFPLITTAAIYFILIAILVWVINRINPLIDISKRDVKKALSDIDMSAYNL